MKALPTKKSSSSGLNDTSIKGILPLWSPLAVVAVVSLTVLSCKMSALPLGLRICSSRLHFVGLTLIQQLEIFTERGLLAT